MKQIMTLTTHSQLKALSDPFKAKMMMMLLQKPYTGQQLAEHFNLSRATIHYHLKELERNKLVEIVKREEKHGIIQKFYQSVARGFTPAAELLPHIDEVGETTRQLLIQMVDKTKSRLLGAPASAFKKIKASENPSEWSTLGSIWEITATEGQFQQFIKKFFGLVDQLRKESREAEKQSDAKLYHLSAYGFPVESPMFEEPLQSEKKK
jgi:DNA-binding transcriptional ArsR family regulator